MNNLKNIPIDVKSCGRVRKGIIAGNVHLPATSQKEVLGLLSENAEFVRLWFAGVIMRSPYPRRCSEALPKLAKRTIISPPFFHNPQSYLLGDFTMNLCSQGSVAVPISFVHPPEFKAENFIMYWKPSIFHNKGTHPTTSDS